MILQSTDVRKGLSAFRALGLSKRSFKAFTPYIIMTLHQTSAKWQIAFQNHYENSEETPLVSKRLYGPCIIPYGLLILFPKPNFFINFL